MDPRGLRQRPTRSKVSVAARKMIVSSPDVEFDGRSRGWAGGGKDAFDQSIELFEPERQDEDEAEAEGWILLPQSQPPKTRCGELQEPEGQIEDLDLGADDGTSLFAGLDHDDEEEEQNHHPPTTSVFPYLEKKH